MHTCVFIAAKNAELLRPTTVSVSVKMVRRTEAAALTASAGPGVERERSL